MPPPQPLGTNADKGDKGERVAGWQRVTGEGEKVAGEGERATWSNLEGEVRICTHRRDKQSGNVKCCRLESESDYKVLLREGI